MFGQLELSLRGYTLYQIDQVEFAVSAAACHDVEVGESANGDNASLVCCGNGGDGSVHLCIPYVHVAVGVTRYYATVFVEVETRDVFGCSVILKKSNLKIQSSISCLQRHYKTRFIMALVFGMCTEYSN